MTRPRAALAVAVAALAVAGCGPSGDSPGTVSVAPSRWTAMGCCLARVVDLDAGVVCWVRSAGIACLPCADVAPGTCDGDGGGR